MLNRLWALFARPRNWDEAMANRLLSDPINHPAMLDELWALFEATKDPQAVRRIVSVLDWKDLVRLRLEEWLKPVRPEMWGHAPYRDYQLMFDRCVFPIDYDQSSIAGPVDLDLHVALLLKNRALQLTELPIPFSAVEVQYMAMKSAAVWSLRSQAETFPQVAQICREESVKPGGASRPLLGV